MQVAINEEACIGCGTCSGICPAVFELQATGKAKVKDGVNLDDNKEKIQEAATSCPTQAISVTE